jgi:hypothetical protein
MKTRLFKRIITLLFLSFFNYSVSEAQYMEFILKDGTNRKIEWTGNMIIDMDENGFIIVKQYNARVLELKKDDVTNMYYFAGTYFKPGDVNKDKKVDISDVVAVINVIAGKDYHVTVPTEDDDPWGLCPDSHHPHAINMGKAGVWSCCNIGATSPVERGSFYAWGETEEKENYTFDTYQYARTDTEGHKTYEELLPDISGSQYDVAHLQWGGYWVMPSSKDFDQLLNNCKREEVHINGVHGTKFTYIDIPEKEPNSLFFPCVGCMEGNINWINFPSTPLEGESMYWLSDTKTESKFGIVYNEPYPSVIFHETISGVWPDRYYGCAIRPIQK